jgi:hypothetical protein
MPHYYSAACTRQKQLVHCMMLYLLGFKSKMLLAEVAECNNEGCCNYFRNYWMDMQLLDKEF